MGLTSTLTSLVDKGQLGSRTILLGRVTNTAGYNSTRVVDIELYMEDGTTVPYQGVRVGGGVINILHAPACPQKGELVIVALLGKGNHRGHGHGAVILMTVHPDTIKEIFPQQNHAPTAKPATTAKRLSGSNKSAGAAGL